MSIRSGFITLLGCPNAGKSTLLNAVLGQKISIVSAKPQTTRNRVLGIHTTPQLQAVLVDTPGVHQATSRLNRAMVQVAKNALSGVDAICWVVDATSLAERAKNGAEVLGRREMRLAELVEGCGVEQVSVALNKIDLTDKTWLLPVLKGLSERLPSATLVPISALKRQGITELIGVWRDQLPESAPLFPEDQVTDVSERFLVAELIREKVFKQTREEIPYSTAIEIVDFKEETRASGRPLVRILASILVERDSQKGIIIGKKGSRLREIGSQSRKDIEAMLGVQVYLDLHVKVASRWTDSTRLLRELGYE